MNITIHPGKLNGSINAIPSKSLANRYLICAAFSDGPTVMICPEVSRDIEATADCLNALGASVIRTATGYEITPIQTIPKTAVLNCCESASTLRFLLPIVGALGVDATFLMEGRLPCRPVSPLWEEMERMGCTLTRPSESSIRCSGKLNAGTYYMDGSVSSQFVSGLLFATSLIEGACDLNITGKIESAPYINMTMAAMNLFNSPDYRSPGFIEVEGDWSNSAFFLCANVLGNHVNITNLNTDSFQGDRAICDILPALETHLHIDAADIPDLVPVLAVVAAAKKGATFTNVQRLRLKESDRVASVVEMIRSLGGAAETADNTLTVYGTGLFGGTVNSHHDHRIAMSAAIAATISSKPVTILQADAVKKSYPAFWEEYRKLGGSYEQHLR